MHKGSAYPYHPTFYATEAFFWPGYLPWKMVLDVTATGTPPWNIYPSLYQEISIPGVVSASGHTVTYDFTAHVPGYGLRLVIDDYVDAGWLNARWRLQLISGIAMWAFASNLQPTPLRSVFCNRWPIYAGSIPYPAVGPPPYLLRPAIYLEGGSPWPAIGPP